MLNYAAIVLTASMVLGAEDRGKQADLKVLRPLLGTWEVPEFKFEGETHHVQVAWKPILDGRFIESRWVSVNKDTDELVIAGLDIIGLDPADGKLKFWEFDVKGGFAQLVLAEGDAKASTWTFSSVEADGKKRTGKTTFEPIDRNSYNWSLTYDDGESHKAVFQRTRRKSSSWPELTFKMPEDVSDPLKELAWWVGEFAFSGTHATSGLAFNGRSNCRWILDGKYLLYQTASVDEELVPTSYRAIIGVDPETGKATGREFNAVGSIGQYVVTDKGQDIDGLGFIPNVGEFDYKGRITKSDDGLIYRSRGKHSDGKEVLYSFQWVRKTEE
jgi:hypothetical protein